MDTSKFLKQIRSIIREEIEYALDKKLNENRKKDDRQILAHGMNLMKSVNKVQSKPIQKQTKKVSPVTQTSSKMSIQSLLDETRRSIEESMHQEDDGEFNFTTNSLNSFSKGHIDATPNGLSSNEVPPEVAKALTKDYSALMAKIKEKTGR